MERGETPFVLFIYPGEIRSMNIWESAPRMFKQATENATFFIKDSLGRMHGFQVVAMNAPDPESRAVLVLRLYRDRNRVIYGFPAVIVDDCSDLGVVNEVSVAVADAPPLMVCTPDVGQEYCMAPIEYEVAYCHLLIREGSYALTEILTEATRLQDPGNPVHIREEDVIEGIMTHIRSALRRISTSPEIFSEEYFQERIFKVTRRKVDKLSGDPLVTDDPDNIVLFPGPPKV
jgi:hypothetical protein